MILPLLELNLLRTEKWPDHSFRLPSWQAHRGYWSGGLQENTLSSLIEAKKLGFQMAEFDVQLSQDRIPILFHDSDLARIAKKRIAVSQLDAKDLKALAQAPSLEDVLTHPDVPENLNIEIKSGFLVKDPLIEPVVQVIKKTKSQSRVLISSFNPWCLVKIKMLMPEVPLALLASPEKVKGNALYLRRVWMTPVIRPQLLNLDHHMLDQAFLNLIQKNSLSVAAWTVNEKSRAEHLLRNGIKSVITDKNFLA